MQHSSKCLKSVGLTEKFKENSCKLILYVINETFHSYVNIKCLGIFFPFFSFPLTELPLPDLHYVFVCFVGWWVGWHGGIFPWEEELIAESCDSFTEQTAVLPLIHPSSDVHPTPGEELPEGSVCLCLCCWSSLSTFLRTSLDRATPRSRGADTSPWSLLYVGGSVVATSPSLKKIFQGSLLIE